MKLYACSDIHTDYEENMAWVESMAAEQCEEKENSACIIAGDVSDKLDVLEQTFALFKKAFGTGV